MKSVFRHAAWLSVSKGAKLLTDFFVMAWVARYLGPTSFGSWTYIIAYVSILSAFGSLGLNEPLLVKQFIEGGVDQRKAILATALGLRFWATFLVWIMGGSLFTWLHASDPIYLVGYLLFSLTLFSQPFNIVDYYYQSRSDARIPTLAKTGTLFFFSILKLIAIQIGASMLIFIIIATLETIVGFVIIFIFYGRQYKFPRFKEYNRVFAFHLIKLAWPLMFSEVAILIYMRIDQVMLAQLVGKHAVGIYAAALRFSEIWYTVPVIVSVSALSNVLNTPIAAVQERKNQHVFDAMIWSGIGLSGLIVFNAPWLIRLAFGSSYQEAIPVLQVHIWASVFVFIGVHATNLRIAKGDTQTPLYASILGAVSNILLNFWLIPNWQSLGAAWGTLLAYAISVGFLIGYKTPFSLTYYVWNAFQIGRIMKIKKLLLKSF